MSLVHSRQLKATQNRYGEREGNCICQYPNTHRKDWLRPLEGQTPPAFKFKERSRLEATVRNSSLEEEHTVLKALHDRLFEETRIGSGLLCYR